MEETKIYKFERDYANSLEYTFFNLFPQNVTNIAVSYDQSKTLTASATFEYTRYVSGPISSISAYRSGAGFNNLTVDELKKHANFKFRDKEDINKKNDIVKAEENNIKPKFSGRIEKDGRGPELNNLSELYIWSGSNGGLSF